MRFLIALIISIGAASAVAAQPAEPPAAVPKAVKKDDRVKCRKEAPIGSLVPKRVCTTTRTEDQNRENARGLLQRPVQGVPPQ